MSDENMQLLFAAMIALTGTVLGAYRTFVAWWMPDQHMEHLKWWSRFYRGWSPDGEKWWSSEVNFWIMRFVFTLFFLFNIYALFLLASFLAD
ncbi:MAG: hypothetical protein KF753_17865 [Caldilineaceae bacterium]|nr:hypothetical protein [Caldilineaceae bacterium]